MKFGKEEIEQIARLARLELSEKEKEQYAGQLSSVLEYIEMLNEVDTDEIEETCQVTGLEDVIREDEPKDCELETKKMLLQQFPVQSKNQLKVMAVFDNRDESE